MRESRSYGSVRGALSNERPYRVRHCLLRCMSLLMARPLTTESDVRSHVGDKGISGLLLLNVSFVVDDSLRSAPGSWQRIGGASPPRGRSSQLSRPRVMHEILLARAAVKRSQGRPRAKY